MQTHFNRIVVPKFFGDFGKLVDRHRLPSPDLAQICAGNQQAIVDPRNPVIMEKGGVSIPIFTHPDQQITEFVQGGIHLALPPSGGRSSMITLMRSIIHNLSSIFFC